jgi:uncharacterized caspase-like protein
MREAIRAFGQTVQGAEMALVYFAGHGLEVAGENWLLPVSAAFTNERDLEYEAVSLSSILTAVKDATKLRLVILDACRNNPLGERIALPSAATRSVLRGLARVEPSGDIRNHLFPGWILAATVAMPAALSRSGSLDRWEHAELRCWPKARAGII